MEAWHAAVKILCLENKNFFGGIERCEFSLDKLLCILKLGLIKPEHRYNYSPSVEVFYEFGKRAVKYNVSVEYIGFFESEYRKDARLVIEGIKVTNVPDSSEFIMDFAQTFHKADEFTANRNLLRAWYD